jgi:hypothetical protein
LATDYFFLVSVGYALLTIAIGAFEVRRTKESGPDVLSLFMALFVLQCCLPGVVIYACLPFVGLREPTEIPAFDRIFAAINLPSALLVLGLTASFAFFFYAFTALGGYLLRRFIPRLPSGSWLVLSGSAVRLLIVLALGLTLTLISFWLMGDTLVERYANLILLRAYSDEVERNKLNAYAFAFTQSWGWLSVVALFVVFERYGRNLVWYLCLSCAIVFAILNVSRRAIFIPLLLGYLTLVLFDGRWRLRAILVGSIPVLLLVAFGKEALSVVAYGGTGDEISARYGTVASALLRTASEVGITVLESIGSVNLMDLAPRFGVDHLLSVLRRIPAGWFGLDLGLPIRVVRLSTQAFASADDQDIPPGLFGQMWLDFRVFGPIVWALVLATQMSVLQRIFALTVRTRQATAAFVLLTFIVALPINTGSYDFTFSVDIIVLMSVILLTFKVARLRLSEAAAGSINH